MMGEFTARYLFQLIEQACLKLDDNTISDEEKKHDLAFFVKAILKFIQLLPCALAKKKKAVSADELIPAAHALLHSYNKGNNKKKKGKFQEYIERLKKQIPEVESFFHGDTRSKSQYAMTVFFSYFEYFRDEDAEKDKEAESHLKNLKSSFEMDMAFAFFLSISAAEKAKALLSSNADNRVVVFFQECRQIFALLADAYDDIPITSDRLFAAIPKKHEFFEGCSLNASELYSFFEFLLKTGERKKIKGDQLSVVRVFFGAIHRQHFEAKTVIYRAFKKVEKGGEATRVATRLLSALLEKENISSEEIGSILNIKDIAGNIIPERLARLVRVTEENPSSKTVSLDRDRCSRIFVSADLLKKVSHFLDLCPSNNDLSLNNKLHNSLIRLKTSLKASMREYELSSEDLKEVEGRFCEINKILRGENTDSDGYVVLESHDALLEKVQELLHAFLSQLFSEPSREFATFFEERNKIIPSGRIPSLLEKIFELQREEKIRANRHLYSLLEWLKDSLQASMCKLELPNEELYALKKKFDEIDEKNEIFKLKALPEELISSLLSFFDERNAKRSTQQVLPGPGFFNGEKDVPSNSPPSSAENNTTKRP